MVGFNQWYASHPPLLIMKSNLNKQEMKKKNIDFFVLFSFFVGGGVISVFGEIDH